MTAFGAPNGDPRGARDPGRAADRPAADADSGRAADLPDSEAGGSAGDRARSGMAGRLFQRFVARLPDGEREIEVAEDGERYLIRHGTGASSEQEEREKPRDSAAEWEDLGDSRVLFTLDGVRHEVRMTKMPDGACRIEWRGRTVLVRVEDDLAERARLARAQHAGPLALRSPMPGTVVKILVEAGQVVTLEQPVLIIEAMKMQNELAAPLSGTVIDLRVRPGQAVEADQILLEIRP